MERSDVDRLHRLLEEVERARAAIAEVVFPPPAVPVAGDRATADPVDALVELLAQVRSTMLRNPAGANAVVSWLVDEGRRYATTPEGAAWRDRLLAADELERLRELWEATSVGVFDRADDPHRVPVAWIDLVHDLVTSGAATDDVIDALRPEGLA